MARPRGASARAAGEPRHGADRQLVVPPAVTPHTVPEAEQYVRWLRLAATLKAQAPERGSAEECDKHAVGLR